MKIVIDARIRRSSTGRYTDRLVEHLQQIDHDNEYVILVQPDDNWKMSANNFRTVICPFPQFSVNPLDQFKFAGLLYSLKPDLVHFTMTQQPLLYFGKIVTTTHDLTMLNFTRPGRHTRLFHLIRMRLYNFMFWWSHKKSDAIIVPSNYVAKSLAKLQPFTSNKIKVTYESSEPPIKGPSEAIIGLDKPFIIHVGSPFPHKNIDNLIKVFGILKLNHPKLSLVLAGKKEFYFEKLEKSIRKNEHKNSIIIPGFVSDGQLKWLYENAECYILPSLSEGFGLPGLEAMAHGLSLASSNATCLPEVYGDAALYFNPNNIEDMELKIDRLLRDKQLKRNLIKRGKQQIKKYSWDKMAKQTQEIYLSLLKKY